MIEFTNKRNYSQYILFITLTLLVAILIGYFFKPQYLGVSLALFVFVELIILSKRFTHKLCVSGTTIQIVYYKWGAKKAIQLDVHNCDAVETTVVENRGYKHQALKILSNGELKYTCEASDGFDPDDLNAFASAIRNAKPKS